jgi:hypothetical protein
MLLLMRESTGLAMISHFPLEVAGKLNISKKRRFLVQKCLIFSDR